MRATPHLPRPAESDRETVNKKRGRGSSVFIHASMNITILSQKGEGQVSLDIHLLSKKGRIKCPKFIHVSINSTGNIIIILSTKREGHVVTISVWLFLGSTLQIRACMTFIIIMNKILCHTQKLPMNNN